MSDRPFRRLVPVGGAAMALALSFFGGCASASIRVAYREPVNVTLNRLFVVVFKGHLLDGSYARFLATSVSSELSVHVAAADAAIVTEMELDPKALPDRIARFGADGVLVLTPIGSTLVGEIGTDNPERYGLARDVRYLATLFETKSDRVVWRAEVLHDGIPSRVKERSQLAAQRIVTALRDDHLIR